MENDNLFVNNSDETSSETENIVQSYVEEVETLETEEDKKVDFDDTSVYDTLSDDDIKIIEDEAYRIENENERLLEDLRANIPDFDSTDFSPQKKVSFNGGVKKVTPDQVAGTNRQQSNEANQPAEPKSETFFVNVLDFTMSYFSKVYAETTIQSGRRIWLNDWWKYPAVVSRMNALWIAWERSYKANQIDTWFLNIAEPMMRYLADKEVGVMTHYINDDTSNMVRVAKGEYLPTIEPPYNWFNVIADELQSLGRLELKRIENERMSKTEHFQD